MPNDNNPRGKNLSNGATDALFLEDLHRDMTASLGCDPGPDPTWDPGEWPEEDEKTEDEKDVQDEDK